MSNVNLRVTTATTAYNVTLDQMAALIAENLDVPVECITVRYQLEGHDQDGHGYASPYVGGVEVIVDNVAKHRLTERGDRGSSG